jgi:hypothetical protein
VGLAGSLVIAALFAWEVHVALPATIDDAYITFSYSRNVALGHGPVYGHREIVEGYSNFLWMMVMAGGLAVRPAADPAVLARWLALPFVALLVLSTYRLAREKVGMVSALAAAALTIVNADAVMAFQIGLETLPHTALLTLGFWLYARSSSRPELAPLVVPAFGWSSSWASRPRAARGARATASRAGQGCGRTRSGPGRGCSSTCCGSRGAGTPMVCRCHPPTTRRRCCRR